MKHRWPWSGSALANSPFNETNECVYNIQVLIFRETKVSIDVQTRGSPVARSLNLKPLTNMGDFERVEYSMFLKIGWPFDCVSMPLTTYVSGTLGAYAKITGRHMMDSY
jgi:hypothetical protein